MQLALAAFDNRIASLFESSNQFIFAKIPIADESYQRIIKIQDSSIIKLIQLLKENNTTTLICGAINGCSFRAIQSNRIHVLPWITGDVESVIKAYNAGGLEKYVMPGCQFRHRLRKGRGKRYGSSNNNAWQ